MNINAASTLIRDQVGNLPASNNRKVKIQEDVLDARTEEKPGCGCGTGTILAFLPPLFFKARNRWGRRKKSKEAVACTGHAVAGSCVTPYIRSLRPRNSMEMEKGFLMNSNNCHALKVCVMLSLSICSIVFAKQKYETGIDTFTVTMSEAEFDLSVIHWLKNIHGNVGVFSGTSGDDTLSSCLVTGLLRTGLLINKEYDDSGAIKIELTHIWNRGYRGISLYRIPNVTYTLKQELGFPGEAGQKITEKSYPVFLGLTLLNSGIGMGYASYKSPFSRGNVPFTVFYALMDAALTAGLFVDDKGIRGFSSFFLPAAKLAVCIRLGFIAEHNKFVKTGYRFILDR